MKEILANLIFPVIKQIGIIELKGILAKIQAEEPPAKFVDILKSLNSTWRVIQTYAVQTKTKIDDGFVDTILQAVTETANENGIQL